MHFACILTHINVYPYAYMFACIPMHFAYVLTHVCMYPYACLHASYAFCIYAQEEEHEEEGKLICFLFTRMCVTILFVK